MIHASSQYRISKWEMSVLWKTSFPMWRIEKFCKDNEILDMNDSYVFRIETIEND